MSTGISDDKSIPMWRKKVFSEHCLSISPSKRIYGIMFPLFPGDISLGKVNCPLGPCALSNSPHRSFSSHTAFAKSVRSRRRSRNAVFRIFFRQMSSPTTKQWLSLSSIFEIHICWPRGVNLGHRSRQLSRTFDNSTMPLPTLAVVLGAFASFSGFLWVALCLFVCSQARLLMTFLIIIQIRLRHRLHLRM